MKSFKLMNGISRRSFMAGAANMTGLLTIGSQTAWAQEPAKPAEIIVRAWGGSWKDALENGVAKSFTADTGIKVTFDTTYNEEIKPKIWAAIDQGRAPPVHVNWDISDTAVESALRGACVDLSDLSNLGGLSDIAIPKGMKGLPYVNVYTYVYALVYSTKAFPDGAPKSWNVMLEPQFSGRVGLYDTGHGIIEVAPIAGGGSRENLSGDMQPAWDWLKKVKANKPLLGKDPDFTKWLQANEVDLACTILTNAVEVKKGGANVAWTVPEEGAYAATDCLWVPVGLPDNETYWAKAFVNHALLKETQQTWCNALGLPGTVKGFEPPEEFKNDPAYPITDAQFKNLIFIPEVEKAKVWSDWELNYKEIMNT